MQKKLYTYTTCLILLAILREEVFAEEIICRKIFSRNLNLRFYTNIAKLNAANLSCQEPITKLNSANFF